MSTSVGFSGTRRSRFARAVAGIAAVTFAVSALVLGGATASSAAPEDALTVTIIKPDGTPVAPGEVLPEGTPL